MTAAVIAWLFAGADVAIESGETISSSHKPDDGSEQLAVAVASDDVDLWSYRDRTVLVLRRYWRLAIEVGRLPSLLGREFFRTRVSSYHTQTFEDSVILVHDVEVCLQLLDTVDRTLIGMILIQEHSQEETAILLHCTRRTIVRRYGEALDHVSAIFLERNILTRLPCRSSNCRETCQGGEREEFRLTVSE
jgi:hypothetical protein